MTIVRSPVRSPVRDPVRSVFGVGTSLLGQATGYLAGNTPYHWFDFVNNRALYAGVDVGAISNATGYSFSRASTGYYTNSDGTLTSFASGALRRGDRGVLIEGARTNLLLRSQEFDNAAWTKTAASVAANSAAAPDGTTTADTLTEDGTSSTHRVIQAVTTTAAAHSFTFCVKPNGRTWVYARLDDNSAANLHVWFDIGTGAVGTTNPGLTGATIMALANGWYRCAVTITTAKAGSNNVIIGLATGDGVSTYAGDGTSGVYLWQADLQLGAFASSPIVTTSSSATRASDVLTCTAGVSYPLTLWAEFERAVDTGGTEIVFQVDAGDNNNQSNFGPLGSSDKLRSTVTAGGVGQADVQSAASIVVGTPVKAAQRIDTNDVRACLDGVLMTQDTSVTLPTNPTNIRFGRNAVEPFGYIRRAAILTSAANDAALEAMTT